MITLGILSQDDPETDPSITLLKERANKKFKIEVYDPRKCLLSSDEEKGNIVIYEGKLVSCNVLLSRIGTEKTKFEFEHALCVLSHFCSSGMKVINRIEKVEISNDKLKTYQLLSQAKIPIPKTVAISKVEEERATIENIEAALDQLACQKFVIKSLHGYGGFGIMLAESRASARSLIQSLLTLEERMIVQEFIEMKEVEDIRVLVVGNKISSIIKRVPQKRGEFRANVSHGGKGVFQKLSKQIEEIAKKTARVSGLDIVGVDLLERKVGDYVISEINPDPILREMEEIGKRPVAQDVLRLVLNVYQRRK